ncbi:threonine/homoserine/homoserine lactone efflux protein [Rhizobium azibense]|uniref:Threonine/homoserine/homoserine lactone efflux protein n=1 Tax=Rhizobium azibense TaxID=1136135 RepID=A0A4R3RSW1_9HYPH|nr:threonine transporter RhtB [Rhizobium azibense]TCU24434.1 threonine/homoserine/homoserine lactone efflux protein [Rhizobium azibense]TCU39180.1 threonine/homoserine/homoserine lactone efflux protein [Rhizobium azibense]
MNQFSMAAGALALLAMPGPTNTLLALAACRRGARQLAVLAATVVAAYLVVVVLLAVFAGAFVHSNPQIAAALKLASAAWVLYLAFRLWSAPGPVSADDVSARHVLITTLLNPKAIIIGLAMVPAADVSTQIPHLVTLAFVVAATSMLWLAFGKLVIGEQEMLPMLVRRCSCAVLMLFSASMTASLFS